MNLFVIFAVILTSLAVVIVIRPLLRGTAQASSAPVVAGVLGVALSAAVLIIYFSVGNHDWSSPTFAPARSSAAGGDDGRLGGIGEMAANLENRLRTEPDDVAGWLLLGRTYAQLQQVSDSRRAYRQALALDVSTQAKLGVAEADILLDRQNLMRDAGRLIEEVLIDEPENPKALFYGGMAAKARNDVDLFQDRWRRLLTMSPPDAIRTMIEGQLVDAGGIETPSANTDDDVVTAAVAPATGIDVSISVAAGLAGHIEPQAILFLVARTPDRPGPPLAAVRRSASELPIVINISDANAMIPGRTIASLPRVQLIARITNSGEPVAQPGDLFGERVWVASEASDDGVSIIVDQVTD